MPLKMKPTSVIQARLGIQNGGPAHAYFTERCAVHMDKYVPYSGNSGRIHLRENVVKDTDYIAYQQPYARYQYYGVREDGSHAVKNYTTPGTGTYWDKKMWTAEGKDVVAEVQEYVNTHGGK